METGIYILPKNWTRNKMLHVKAMGFLIHHGLIDIGYSYPLGIWAIELRWHCPLLSTWSFRLWSGRRKPTMMRIGICVILSPVWALWHWLIVVPICIVLFTICFTLALLIMSLGCLFSWLGNKLEKIGKKHV